MIELTFWQKLTIIFEGRVLLGLKRKPGWTVTMAFYAFRCPDHGWVVNYLQGYGRQLECPHCQDDKYRLSRLLP